MRILIVDDEKNIRDSIARFLKLEEIEGVPVENGLVAKKLLEEEMFDAAIIDLKMDGMSGMELLSWIAQEGIRTPVIMISAFGEIHDAVEAMKKGARDYIVKPFDPDELVLRIKRIIGNRQNEDIALVERIKQTDRPIYESETASGKEIERLIDKVAKTDSTVLVSGESGTGKEVTALRIHELSNRFSKPFVPVNIAGIPDTLLESELFGFERGAFTGAQARKIGLTEIAEGGTLFLDEIGDMPVHIQVKVLRFIQERKIQRLGGTRIIPIDVRIIAATNRDLKALIGEGKFREDLYFRLNVFSIVLQPLRERKEDIENFIRYFIGLFNKKMGKRIKGISARALAQLKSYSFPGNIRELENRIERAFILSESDVLNETDFDFPVEQTDRISKPGSIRELEKDAIIDALNNTGWNKTKTSELLGITRRTLFNKIKEYGIEQK